MTTVLVTGIELILSTLCNATVCSVSYDDNPIADKPQTVSQIQLQNTMKEINGKHLKIGTYDNYPLSWVEEAKNGTLIGRGVAFTIINILRDRFNFTFEVIKPERNYEYGGLKYEDSLIGLLRNGTVDMVAAFLPLISNFDKYISYSIALGEGVWMMMLKRPKESAAGSGLLAPFESHVWYLIILAVLCYGPCITLLTRLRSKFVGESEGYVPISPSMWFVYGSFIKQGTTLSPQANTTRVLFATWWLFIILLSSFYTANLTAFLTLSKFTLDIESPKDLLSKNYRWVASKGGSVEVIVKDPDEELYYLNKMVQNGHGEFRSISNHRDYLPLVNGGTVLVKEATAIEYLIYDSYLQKTKEGVEESHRCTYVIAPNAFMKKIRGFAYPQNSTLKTLFDPVLEYLLQAGLIRFLEYRDLPNTKICPLDLQSKERRLRNSDLMMTYMIMAIGLSTAISVFIGEVMTKRYVRIKIRGRPKRNSKRIKNANMQNYDDSRPPPYESLFSSQYKLAEHSQRIMNGREYWVVTMVNGDTRLIPVRTPSAFLFQRAK